MLHWGPACLTRAGPAASCDAADKQSYKRIVLVFKEPLCNLHGARVLTHELQFQHTSGPETHIEPRPFQDNTCLLVCLIVSNTQCVCGSGGGKRPQRTVVMV